MCSPTPDQGGYGDRQGMQREHLGKSHPHGWHAHENLPHTFPSSTFVFSNKCWSHWDLSSINVSFCREMLIRGREELHGCVSTLGRNLPLQSLHPIPKPTGTHPLYEEGNIWGVLAEKKIEWGDWGEHTEIYKSMHGEDRENFLPSNNTRTGSHPMNLTSKRFRMDKRWNLFTEHRAQS